MKIFPLLFSYRDPVLGNGYVAGVEVRGRALLTEEDGEVWLEGVNPGGFAANGATRPEALAAFRTTYQQVLYDIAYEAESYQAFEREVRRFFDGTNKVAAAEFEDAVAAVRRGDVDADWLSKQTFDRDALCVRVVLIDHAEPHENPTVETAVAA